MVWLSSTWHNHYRKFSILNRRLHKRIQNAVAWLVSLHHCWSNISSPQTQELVLSSTIHKNVSLKGTSFYCPWNHSLPLLVSFCLVGLKMTTFVWFWSLDMEINRFWGLWLYEFHQKRLLVSQICFVSP